MVSSQSVIGNCKPKLFSQLNELYGNARTVHRASDNDTLRRSGSRATRYSQSPRGQTLLRTGIAPLDQARAGGRTTAIPVAAKSSPTHSTGCPVRSASAYVKQSP